VSGRGAPPKPRAVASRQRERPRRHLLKTCLHADSTTLRPLILLALRAGGIPIRFSGTPPGLRAGGILVCRSPAAPHPARASGAPPPPPPGGGGSAGDIRGKAVPGMVLTPVSRETGKSQPGPGSSPGSPRGVDRGGYRHGGGDRGGGFASPQGIPIRFSGTPRPARASGAPPPPPPGGEGSHGDIQGKAVPGSGVDAGFSGEGGEVRAQTQFLPGR